MSSIIKKERVNVSEFVPELHAETKHEKSVRVLKREGVVMAIEITCTCGEVTVVELALEDAPQAQPSAPNPEIPQ